MTAQEFLALAEKDWAAANQKVHDVLNTINAGEYLPLCIDELSPLPIRADPYFERKVRDKLFAEVGTKGARITITRYFYDSYALTIIASRGNVITFEFYEESSNLSWLLAAALVELTTEETRL